MNWPTMTEADFPHGLRCPTCDREILPGQPYSEHPDSMQDEHVVVLLTCVYCVG